MLAHPLDCATDANRIGCRRRHRLAQDAASIIDPAWAAEGDLTGARPTLGPALADKHKGRYPHARCVADYPRSDGQGAHRSRLDRPLGTNSHSAHAVRASGIERAKRSGASSDG